ncbi:PIN domain-containing protein [Massilia pseudoviolaceinigra]|uniref:PIN domain-containing protein n=1 Tax=Massilia pseudoviolaceinigra TaxID=3057165 RepID=UPI0027966912|nr:PIN domain-containing protein [Massilia sp. CCM 9206]MDQ1919075.1 PIN domain-containing protein [Massilia sp. CCM 9206]
MALVLFDTNILVDALKGIPEAFRELDYFADPAISAVTWMELIAGAPLSEQPRARAFLVSLRFEVIHTNDAIMHEAASVRGASSRRPPKIALPDAIIKATGNVTQRLIITRNKKDFVGANIRIPYELETQTIVQIINVMPPPAQWLVRHRGAGAGTGVAVIEPGEGGIAVHRRRLRQPR